nr:DUF4397 domain-containing protein [Pedobacter sp. ASV19]
MKNYIMSFIGAVCLFSIALISCKKTEQQITTSSLTVVNGIMDVNRMVPNFSGTTPIKYYSGSIPLVYGAFADNCKFSIEKTEQPLGIFKYPDTLPGSKPLFNLMLHLKPGSINSLFLVGTAAKPDTMMVTTIPPYHNDRDSTFGLRFANLSYLSKPVSIYLLSESSRKEIDGLPYKGISGYKNYYAGLETGNYTFEFRDKETQALLATAVVDGVGGGTGNLRRYRNFTIALKGLPGVTSGDQKQDAFLINDY